MMTENFEEHCRAMAHATPQEVAQYELKKYAWLHYGSVDNVSLIRAAQILPTTAQQAGFCGRITVGSAIGNGIRPW